MSRHWALGSIALGSLLAFTPTLASAALRAGDPCRQMQQTLDRQIDDLKLQQQDEIRQCEQSNGRNSPACMSLREQQKQALQAMRDNRSSRMNGCRGRGALAGPAIVSPVENVNDSYYNQANESYPENGGKPVRRPDPHPRHPRHPPVKDKPASAEKSSPGSGDKSSHSAAANGASSPGHNHGGGSGNSGGGSNNGSAHSSGGSSWGGASSGGSAGGGSSGASHSSSSSGGGSSSGGSSSSGSASSTSSSGGHTPH